MKMRTGLALVITLALLAFGSGAALAGAKDGHQGKVSAALMALHAELLAHRVEQGSAPFAHHVGPMRLIGERVVVNAVALGNAAALRAQLVTLGMQQPVVHGRVVSGQLPITAIPALAGLGELRFVRPSLTAHRVGSVTTQGDVAMRSDVARASFGVSGAGVKVGVLSDSFNCLGGAPVDVATGDLPLVQIVQEISDCTDATDEGRAILQIVHDIAPGAALAFATSDGGAAAFASNILALRAVGAQVIIDDTGEYDEPMFQDGIVAQAADTVVRDGATYLSAAGNDGRNSYEAPFNPGAAFGPNAFPSAGPQAPAFFGGTAHNFAPAGAPPDQLQRITIPAGQVLVLSLQWDSPFASAGGAGSPNDVDVYVFNAAGTQVVGGSTDINIGGDAVEMLFFQNTGPTADFNLMIVSFQGPPPGRLKYISLNPTVSVREFNTASSTVFSQPNAAGVIAVGAVAFSATPAFGVTPPVLEPFSSAGGTPILFDTAGNRLAAPVVRDKPEILAPDGVITSVLGFSQFFGTSASVGHAAGVAALMLEKQPVLAAVTISSALEATAINVGPPGFDFNSGFGFVQADVAVGHISTLEPLAAAILPSSRSVAVGGLATAFATVLNGGSRTAMGVGLSLATPLLGTFSYQTTDPNTNAVTGTPNTPADIPAGGSQTYVVSITPSATFSGNDVRFAFAGSNTFPVPPLNGVSTLTLTASASPGPDIVALAATTTPSLTAVIPGSNGSVAFAVASANVAAAGSIAVAANKGNLPIAVLVCETDSTGSCGGSSPAPSLTTNIGAGETPTFSFFVQGQGFVPFDPATNRVFVTFTDTATGSTVGSTSVAVRTQ
jgi:hypothetical protein